MNALKKITTLALLSLLLTQAHAETSDTGFYGTANFGNTNVHGTVKMTGYLDGKSDTNSNTWSLGLGYDINKYFGVEGGYSQFFKRNSSWSSGSLINNSNKEASGLFINALAKYEVSKGIKIFGGPSVITAKIKENSAYVNGTTTQYTNSSKSITPFGYIIGASLALDDRTDVRISYSAYNKFSWSHPAGTGTSVYPANTETDKVSLIHLGISVKF